MTSSALTDRQATVLKVIIEYIETHGLPPTRAELAKLLGFKSINAAEDHLKALARKGAIILSTGTSRGIQVVGHTKNTVPLVSQKDTIDSHIPFTNTLFQPKVDYFFKMPDLSLKPMGILPGDLLAIHRTNQAHGEQLALIYCEHRLIAQLLHLSNKPYSLEGIVVGVIRQMG